MDGFQAALVLLVGTAVLVALIAAAPFLAMLGAILAAIF